MQPKFPKSHCPDWNAARKTRNCNMSDEMRAGLRGTDSKGENLGKVEGGMRSPRGHLGQSLRTDRIFTHRP